MDSAWFSHLSTMKRWEIQKWRWILSEHGDLPPICGHGHGSNMMNANCVSRGYPKGWRKTHHLKHFETTKQHPNGPTMSLFVSPAGSNFVDLRKGHGRTSFVSLVAGHVWWRRIFQCPKRESRINLLLYINWRLTQHHWVFTYPKVEKNNLSVEVSGRRHIALAFWLTFEQWKGIKFTDVFGYIYTSGTTGLPKAPRSGVLTTSKVSILSIFWGFLREKSTVRPNAFFSNAFTFMCWHGFTNSNGKVYSEST